MLLSSSLVAGFTVSVVSCRSRSRARNRIIVVVLESLYCLGADNSAIGGLKCDVAYGSRVHGGGGLRRTNGCLLHVLPIRPITNHLNDAPCLPVNDHIVSLHGGVDAQS